MAIGKHGVVYTCITGGYDELLNHTFTHPDWEYVCFSDDVGIRNEKNTEWEVRPLCFDGLDAVRNQRWHKLHPHLLFPDHEVSLWVDGNVDILDGGIFADIDRALRANCLIASSVHPDRDCLYDEFAACHVLAKDKPEVMIRQEKLIRQTGFPEHNGLFEAGIMLRQHSSPTVGKLMEAWWFWIEHYSRRDQLSFTYVLWQQGMTAEPLSPVSYRKSPGVRFRYGRNHRTKEELIRQNEELEAEVMRLKQSICWRVSKPFRKIRKSAVKRYRRFKNKVISDGIQPLSE